MATPKVRAATAATSEQLWSSTQQKDLAQSMMSNADSKSDLDSGSDQWEIVLAASSSLGPVVRDAIYELFDENMSDLSSSSSIQYTPKSKREELFHEDARYLLVLSKALTGGTSATQTKFEDEGPVTKSDLAGSERDNGQSNSGEGDDGLMKVKAAIRGKGKGKGKGKGNRRAGGNVTSWNAVEIVSRDQLWGYCSFRFDTEETMSTRDAEVIYCYELQLRSSRRKMGLGRILMDVYEDIGRRMGMEKAMLTCYKNNTTAMRFYDKQGYRPDEIDPTRLDEEDSDEEEDVDDGEMDRNLGSRRDVEGQTEGELHNQVADYRLLSKYLKDG